MIVPLVFWLLLLGSLATSWHAGDRADQQVIWAVIGASLLTMVAQIFLDYMFARGGILVINSVLLVVIVRYALHSSRYWPLWFAGFQGAAVLLGIVTFLLPEGQRTIIAMAGQFWALPALLVMTTGLLLDQRHGITNDAG